MNILTVSEVLQAQIVALEKTKVETGEAYQIYKENLEMTAERIISAASRKKYTDVDLSANTFESYANKRVRMIVTVKQESPENILMKVEIEPVDVLGKIRSFHSFVFDSNGSDISSCLMNNKSLIMKIRAAKGSRIEIFGTVIMVPISRKKYAPMLFVDKVKRANSYVKVLNPPKPIALKADSILKKSGSKLFNLLVEKVCNAVGVVGSRDSSTAVKAVEFSVLAAASSPMLEDKNGRIHSLFHGPPASGKQKAARAAKITNPICEEVTGGRVTSAGFASSFSCDPKTNKPVSQKGYLAKADGGIVIIEDYHAMDEKTRDRIMAILSPQMENGYFEDSTSARTRHSAATAIHLDGNFKGHVDKRKVYVAQEEISLPYNIVTRFDIIMNIKPIQVTDESIVDMIQSTMRDQGEKPDSSLLYKTIIAKLLDQIPIVDVAPVKTIIAERYQQFRKDNFAVLESSSELQSVFARSYKSLRKIIVAHARLHQRSVANIEDVDYAIEVFNIKLKALRTLIPSVKINNALSGTASKTRSRQKTIISNFSGKTVSLHQVKIFLIKLGYEVGDRTLRRDLNGIGKNVGRKWKIPNL